MDDFLGEDMDGLEEKMKAFQDKMRAESMREAYRFIDEVGILFWIRKDMYVKNSRKINILEKMVEYFQELEEYEKCAYLMKGVRVLQDQIFPKGETV
jgi:Zn/Cd-binding protein ZinT